MAFAATHPRQALAADRYRACLIKDDGTLWFWGGATVRGDAHLNARDSADPLQQAGLSGMVAIAAKGYGAVEPPPAGSA